MTTVAINDQDAQARIAELRIDIERHNKLYYEDAAPEISDREYDGLLGELSELEKRFPQFTIKTSPTQKVGGSVSSIGFAQVQHPVPMLSIGNTYNEDELRAWDKRIRDELGGSLVSYICELKIDGLSMTLMYEDGKLKYGATRGNGEVGDNVTANLMHVKGVLHDLPTPEGVDWKGRSIEIRGEVYMTHDDMKKLNEIRQVEGDALFANPRNAAAGSVKQKDAAEAAKRPLCFFAYAAGKADFKLPATQTGLLDLFDTIGFQVNQDRWACNTVDEVIKLVKMLDPIRRNYPYDVDGLVIKVNERKYWDQLGYNSKTPRFMTAYKFSAEEAQTVLKEVTFQVGRTGAVTPVANMEPVPLAGSVVARATLHNADEIQRLGVMIGDTVVIQKAGDIIPKVIRVVTSLRNGTQQPIIFPSNCPECSEKLVQQNGEVAHRCVNEHCPAQVKESLRHFASKAAMDIEGLGDAMVELIVDNLDVRFYPEIYILTAENISGLPRQGKRSAEKLIAQIEKSKQRPLHNFLFGLGISLIGSSSTKALAKRFATINEIMDATLDDFINTPDMGTVNSQNLYNYWNGPNGNLHRLQVKSVLALGLELPNTLQKKKASGTAFAGEKVVFTGGLTTMKRPEAQALVEDLGGEIGSGISKGVTLVVAGEDAGSKLDKATKLGITVIDETEFRKRTGL